MESTSNTSHGSDLMAVKKIIRTDNGFTNQRLLKTWIKHCHNVIQENERFAILGSLLIKKGYLFEFDNRVRIFFYYVRSLTVILKVLTSMVANQCFCFRSYENTVTELRILSYVIVLCLCSKLKIFSFRDNEGMQKSISERIDANYIDIPLQASRKYIFAVAIIHKDFSDKKQLYTTTKQIETAGAAIQPTKILSVDNGNLIWQEDDFIDNYRVVSRNVCIV